MQAGAIMENINKLPEMLKAAKGGVAQFAVDAKLVDGLNA